MSVRSLVVAGALAAPSLLHAQIFLDGSFGTAGLARTGAPTVAEVWNSVSVQPDARIVAVGSRTNSSGLSNFLIARFLPDGTPDTSFNATGIVELDFGADRSDAATSVVILPDSRILIAGESRKYASVTTSQGTTFGPYADLALARLTASGAIDASFGSGGTARIDLSQGLDDTCARLLVLPSGAIRIAGTTGTNPSNRNVLHWSIVGLTPSGAVDPSFGVAGRVVVPLASTSSSVYNAVLADSAITVVGDNTQSFTVLRVDAATGQRDASFGTNGLVSIAFPPPVGRDGVLFSRATAAIPQTGGRLVLLGSGEFFDFAFDTFDATQLYAVRLTSTGAVDPTFTFPNAQLPAAAPAVVQVGSSILLADQTLPVRSLNADSGALIASTSSAISANTLAVQAGNAVVIAGRTNPAGDAAAQRITFDPGLPTPPAAPPHLGAPRGAPPPHALPGRDNASDETAYLVERASSPSFTDVSVLASLPANATTYTDGGLPPRTTFYYRVRAVNSAGSSTSNTLKATTLRR